MIIASLFTTFVYQPFFNILIFIYWVLDLVSKQPADMGVAVILLTLLIRFLLLPLSLIGGRSEKERRDIAQKVREIETEHSADPIVVKKKRKLVMRKSRRVLISEMISLFIQVSISLMLWKIFSTGLTGQDFHFIYDFMPEVETPLNLLFLGKYDLSHPHWTLNLVQSFLIFVLETLSVYTSPYRHTKMEVIRLQLVLPVLSFIIFSQLPAGKKLFVITTLCFSIVLTLAKAIRRKALAISKKWNQGEEEVLVAVTEL